MRTLCVTRFTSDKTSPTTNPKTPTTMKLTLMRECYCVSRSSIDENNGSVGRSLIVFHHGIAPKVTSAAEIQLLFKERSFSSPSLYLSYVVSSYSLYLSYVAFIIQSLLCKELFHQSRFYLNNVDFHHPASNLQRTISSIQVLCKQRSF